MKGLRAPVSRIDPARDRIREKLLELFGMADIPEQVDFSMLALSRVEDRHPHSRTLSYANSQRARRSRPS